MQVNSTPAQSFTDLYEKRRPASDNPQAAARVGDHDASVKEPRHREVVEQIQQARLGAALYRQDKALADMTVKALAETLGLSSESTTTTPHFGAHPAAAHPAAAHPAAAHPAGDLYVASLYAQSLLLPNRGHALNKHA